MTDEKGQMIELVEGNWHNHIAVNWFETVDGNYIEVVQNKQALEKREAEVIAKGQAALEARRKSLPKEKITQAVRSYSKDRQLGKKGA